MKKRIAQNRKHSIGVKKRIEGHRKHSITIFLHGKTRREMINNKPPLDSKTTWHISPIRYLLICGDFIAYIHVVRVYTRERDMLLQQLLNIVE